MEWEQHVPWRGCYRAGWRRMSICQRCAAGWLCMMVATLALGMSVILESSAESKAALVKIVAQIQRADFEGDRAALDRLSRDLRPFVEDKDLASRVLYWRAFAKWRSALNGFNESVNADDLQHNLKQAVTDFDGAIAKDPGFVDAKIGEASCLMNLTFLDQRPGATEAQQAEAQQYVSGFLALLKESQMAAPENPRLLWVAGASRWYAPPQYGGSQSQALAMYVRGLESARKQRAGKTDSLEPSWGEPELLMSLAWANLHQAAPDLNAARQYAENALALVPYWHYVRDILLPQIQEAQAKQIK